MTIDEVNLSADSFREIHPHAAWLPEPVYFTAARFEDVPMGVILLICNDSGSILMTKNSKRGWELPGGHVEPGESVMGAAARELLEETGYVLDHDLEYVGSLLLADGNRLAIYRGSGSSLSPLKASLECEDAAWMTREQSYSYESSWLLKELEN